MTDGKKDNKIKTTQTHDNTQDIHTQPQQKEGKKEHKTERKTDTTKDSKTQ